MNRIKTLAAAMAVALGASGAWAQTGGENPQQWSGGRQITNGSQSPNSRGSNRPGDVAMQRAPDDTRGWRGNGGRTEAPRAQYRNESPRADYNRNTSRDWRGNGEARGGYAERDWRSYGYDHRWQRGDRLPPEYRSRSYVVDDWRGHRLSAPPRGYHWVQSGNDYLLVAIATGVIASVLLNQ